MLATRDVYRAPMRARSLEAGRYEGARSNIARSLVGIGEPLSRKPVDSQDAIALVAAEFGPKAGRMLARFAAISDGSLVWTQTEPEQFRLGSIVGPWGYDDSLEAARTGIPHVRAAKWLPESFTPDTAPRAVVFAFSRGGRNLQRISDPEAVEFSRHTFSQNAG